MSATTQKEKSDTHSTDKMRRVLLLNASEEMIAFIDWQKAASLLVSGKAVAPYNYDHAYAIRTPCGEFKIPTALVLVEYVRVPYRKAYVTKKNVLRRDNYTCQYCGCRVSFKTGTIDHVLPSSRGGKNDWSNLTTSCRKCNSKKANRTPNEAGMKLLSVPKAPEIDLIHLRAVDHYMDTLWERWIRIPNS
jgi:5-methylcytosine-specific restriction endonuclease McrA